MNSRQKQLAIIVGLTSIVVLVGVLFFALSSNTSPKNEAVQSSMADAEKFAKEYPNVSTNNQFVYATGDEVVSIFEGGSGLVFLGFTECPWCQQLAPIVDEAAKSEGLEKIYYLNIKKARSDNDETYKKLVASLSEYLDKDENGNPRIFVPDVTAVREGVVVGRFEQESAANGEQVTPQTFWTTERRARAVDQLREIIREIQ